MVGLHFDGDIFVLHKPSVSNIVQLKAWKWITF